jgi:hypothetical protein
MESADDSDFSGSDEELNESTGALAKTVTVSIVVPKTSSEHVEKYVSFSQHFLCFALSSFDLM